jgi:hypothetical protein
MNGDRVERCEGGENGVIFREQAPGDVRSQRPWVLRALWVSILTIE